MVRPLCPKRFRIDSGAGGDARSRYARSITVVWGTFSSGVSYDDELSERFDDRNMTLRVQSDANARLRRNRAAGINS
jgi:hypothetical protein